MIETPRLILRRWREEDRAPLIAIYQDPDIVRWLGGPRFVARAAEAVDRYNKRIDTSGFGKFAVERRQDGALLGAVGVGPVHPSLPIEGHEVGWVLARSAWGQGYATEAARAAMDTVFAQGVAEIISFTTSNNLRSQAVMQRLGMARDPARDFDHPDLEDDHPLRSHIVYVARPS